ncbi:hypothetical protein JW935_08925, partial [candidate division KSB1 bacterium]|nr:hypothetical protein [candidate division KSB1 bacterium]
NINILLIYKNSHLINLKQMFFTELVGLITIFSGARASGKTGPPNDFSTQKFSQNAPLLASPAKKCYAYFAT